MAYESCTGVGHGKVLHEGLAKPQIPQRRRQQAPVQLMPNSCLTPLVIMVSDTTNDTSLQAYIRSLTAAAPSDTVFFFVRWA